MIGATAVLRFDRQSNPGKVWAARLLERKRPKVVAVALANKTADRLGADGPQHHLRGLDLGDRHQRGSRDVQGC